MKVVPGTYLSPLPHSPLDVLYIFTGVPFLISPLPVEILRPVLCY